MNVPNLLDDRSYRSPWSSMISGPSSEVSVCPGVRPFRSCSIDKTLQLARAYFISSEVDPDNLPRAEAALVELNSLIELRGEGENVQNVRRFPLLIISLVSNYCVVEQRRNTAVTVDAFCCSQTPTCGAARVRPRYVSHR